MNLNALVGRLIDMQEPRVVTPEEIRDCSTFVEIDGKWFCARSLTMERLILWHRLKLAWFVFIGRYDALKWRED